MDQDGHNDDVDCDDFDPNIWPGAEEIFDGVDNDCDGRVDADGQFSGTTTVTLSAVVKGVSVSYSLDCPSSLDRYGEARVEFVITCDDPNIDDTLSTLMGDQLVFTAVDRAAVTEADWAGAMEVTSTDGWDTPGTGSAHWPNFDTVTLLFSVNAFSLDVTGTGTLTFID